MEYLDAQITISEQPTGSVHIKNEESLDIKSEPDSGYEQQTLVEGENEQDRDNDDDEEEDDKPISELMNYSRANNETLTEKDDEQKEKVDGSEEGTGN